ncbi:glycosyl transferase [Rhizobium sp. R635]|uniref:glycosyltransferase family 2 protein n=1 Tax=Rhizobium sp. R635 TaxID=1764275 RepID=UPI000B52989B|nr:glycosyltransferase family 2 protein [Rhizobium sp. R635]OWV91557.1 glycosyl transferase [Rhizobium sp. R635]
MTTSSPLVTVVIPAYNAEKTLAQTLRSVSAQTYEQLEILVVDDGSRDGTFELAKEYGLSDPRVRLLRQENGGVARARNHGVREARGSYVAPIDADDLWHPRKIEMQVQALGKFPMGRGVAYNWYAAIDGSDVIFGHSRPVIHEGDIFEAMVRENFIGNGSTPLMPRDEVLACGGYDAGLRDQGAEGCEDLKLYLALAERLPFALVPDFLTGYRFTAGNMSSNASRMLKSHGLVMADIKQRHPGLAETATLAEFDTARWYFKKSFYGGDYAQAMQLAPLLVRRFPSTLAVRTARDLWRAAKRQRRRLVKRISGKSPAPPKGAVPMSIALPASGTSFYELVAAKSAGRAGHFSEPRADRL